MTDLHAIEPHLASDPEQADALIDLSNVVRDTGIGGSHARSLDRLGLVVDALARRTGDRNVMVYALADRSLRHSVHEYPGRLEPALLTGWVRAGLVEELSDADERLLDLAEMLGLPVVSRDGFADFRLTHPWIQGNTTQFLAPAPTRVRAVKLVERDMGTRSPAQISRKLEESDLKAHGLLAGRNRKPMTEVVRRYWRCPERGCTLYDSRKGSAVLLPRMRRGVPVCELHRTPLTDDGPRTGITQLKLLVDGVCVQRFTLDADSTVLLGREPGPGGISLYGHVPPDRLRPISRAHLSIRVSAHAVDLRNLGGNGTLLLSNGAGRPTPLADQDYVRLHVGDTAELTDGVHLTRSGRRFPAEIAAAWRGRHKHQSPPKSASARTVLGPNPADNQ
ncbi:FHA domain-containing protein [Streptomyces sp. AC512_CC834]|uniref:FHA domain-containing protein n=1 Tax=Streptomyces sp. AC512_CC834 TaxID=2823691 RepID=UPI001C279246|nr:FHA domain-containing protein [Streptomyces sp. AC512_CC834]